MAYGNNSGRDVVIRNKSDLKDDDSLYYNDIASTSDFIKHSLALAGLVTAGATGLSLKNNGISALAILNPILNPQISDFLHDRIKDYATSKYINTNARVMDVMRREINT